MQLSPWPPCIVGITRPLASVTTCREAASTGVAKVAAVSKTADRSFTLRIGVLHWSGKPDWLLPVTCGRPATVQRAYRFTGFQLGVKSTRGPDLLPSLARNRPPNQPIPAGRFIKSLFIGTARRRGLGFSCGSAVLTPPRRQNNRRADGARRIRKGSGAVWLS